MAAHGSTEAQLRYATALATWGEVGGYEAQVLWDVCTVAALGMTFEASRALARYELAGAAEQSFESLSGGQQARLQVLLLELGGATLLLLDESTDNLDLESAEALQQALTTFEGTALAVTHDRWFVREMDRFLIFGADGYVYESDEAVWDEGRVARQRG